MTKPTHLKFPIVMYNLTEVCQLRCRHCYNESGSGKYTPPARKLWEGLEKVIQAGAGTINFTGGEPFLVSNMTDLVAYAHSCGLNTMLNTNGVLLNSGVGSRFLDALQGKLDLIKIGLSGASQNTNDYIRGKGNFEVVKKSLNVIRGYDPIASCLKVCLDKHNLHEIEGVVQFALDRGVREIFFGQLINTGRAVKEVADLVLDYPEMQMVSDNLDKVQDRYGKDIRIAKYCTLNGKCREPGIYFTVTAKGAVGLCLIREDLAVGNIFQTDDVRSLFDGIDAQREKILIHPSLKDLRVEADKEKGISLEDGALKPILSGILGIKMGPNPPPTP